MDPVYCTQCMQEEARIDAAIIDQNQSLDKNFNRLMGRLKVNCANDGCSWKGILLEYSLHESSCQMDIVTCPHKGCSAMFPR